MTFIYRRLLLDPGLLAPMRRALLARTARAAPGWRLEVWEYEGGSLGLWPVTSARIRAAA